MNEAIMNAFSTTLSNVIDILSDEEQYTFPDNFSRRFQKNKKFLLPALEKLERSRLRELLINFLEEKMQHEIVESPKIFRSLLFNILGELDYKNKNLESISQLVEVFNKHLYRGKRIEITNKSAKIVLDKVTQKEHSLDKLSSGERHLLTLLTVVLVFGASRDFILIDEPEISLNMEWQRDLLPLLNELSPGAQIIVATHSPSIANRNTNYLSELV